MSFFKAALQLWKDAAAAVLSELTGRKGWDDAAKALLAKVADVDTAEAFNRLVAAINKHLERVTKEGSRLRAAELYAETTAGLLRFMVRHEWAFLATPVLREAIPIVQAEHDMACAERDELRRGTGSYVLEAVPDTAAPEKRRLTDKAVDNLSRESERLAQRAVAKVRDKLRHSTGAATSEAPVRVLSLPPGSKIKIHISKGVLHDVTAVLQGHSPGKSFLIAADGKVKQPPASKGRSSATQTLSASPERSTATRESPKATHESPKATQSPSATHESSKATQSSSATPEEPKATQSSSATHESPTSSHESPTSSHESPSADVGPDGAHKLRRPEPFAVPARVAVPAPQLSHAHPSEQQQQLKLLPPQPMPLRPVNTNRPQQRVGGRWRRPVRKRANAPASAPNSDATSETASNTGTTRKKRWRANKENRGEGRVKKLLAVEKQ